MEFKCVISLGNLNVHELWETREPLNFTIRHVRKNMPASARRVHTSPLPCCLKHGTESIHNPTACTTVGEWIDYCSINIWVLNCTSKSLADKAPTLTCSGQWVLSKNATLGNKEGESQCLTLQLLLSLPWCLGGYLSRCWGRASRPSA